jgi:acetyl-CoA acyltransferase
MAREAVLVEAVRTPLGKRNGRLSGRHPVDLLAEVLNETVARSNIDAAEVDDVICGCVSQIGEQSLNIGRNSWLAAGLPEEVPATTIDRQCGSSQQSAHFAAQGVIAGAYDVAIACGVESMSRVPMGSSAQTQGFPFTESLGSLRGWDGSAGHLGRDHLRTVGRDPRGGRRARRAKS